MNPLLEQIQLRTRRHFLGNCGMGLGTGALAQMLSPKAFALDAPKNPLLPRKPHFNSKAKRVIYIHLTGSPPHLDMWDYKPELVKRTDQECPDEFVKGKKFAFTSGTPKLMGTPRTFKQYGKSGMWMSDAIPNFHEHADDFCVIKYSCTLDSHNPVAHPSAPGRLTGWVPKTRTSPDTSCSFPAELNPMGVRTPSVPALSHPFTKAYNADPRGTLCSMFPTLREWIVD